MPTVPVSSGPKVALGGGPGATFAAPQMDVPDARLAAPQLSTPQFSTPQLRADLMRPAEVDPNAIRHVQMSDRGAAQTMAMGQSLTSASQALGHAALEMQVKVNQAVVDDALDKARTAAMKLRYGHLDEATGNVVGGYMNLKGEQAFRRTGPDGQPIGLDDEVGHQYTDAVNSIVADKLTNAAQRQAFGMQANDIGEQLRQGALVHQADQFNTYYQGVYTEGLKNQTAAFGMLDPGDRASQAKAMDDIERTVGTLAVHNGASKAELDVGVRTARTNAVSALFEQTVSQQKYLTASALLNEYGKDIDPGAAAKMRSALEGHVSLQVGEQIGADLWSHQAAPVYADQGYTRLQNLVEHAESRGHDTNPDGTPLVSPKGAKGRMQVMPGTNTDPGFGVRPAKDDSPEERARVGRDYLGAMVQRYGGDVQKALVAYNWGPGNLEAAMKQYGPAWLDHAPAETRKYVSGIMQAYTAGDGQPPRPSKAQIYAQIETRTQDPEARKAARNYVDQKFAAADYDERKGQDDAMAEGIRVVRESGGNLNAISPELKAKIEPKDYTALESFAKNTTEGQFTVTKPEAYYAVMNPAALKAMTPAQLERASLDLSETDRNTLRRTWMDIHAPEPGKGPDSLDVSTVDSIVKTRLQYMGVDVNPKKGDTKSEARLGAITQFAHQYVLDRQKQKGAKFVDYGDLEKTVNELFLKNQGFKNTVFGITTHGQQNVITSQVKDIPSDTRANLKTQLHKGLGRDPSDAEMLQAYFRSQFYKGG